MESNKNSAHSNSLPDGEPLIDINDSESCSEIVRVSGELQAVGCKHVVEVFS